MGGLFFDAAIAVAENVQQPQEVQVEVEGVCVSASVPGQK